MVSFQQVPLADIGDDGTLVVTFRPEMQALQRSVARVGVLTPLHLRRVPGQTRLQVVCGSKRLRACQDTGHTTVPALVYESEELPDQQAFLLAMYDNLGCRPLNAVEKGRILLRLRNIFGYSPATLCTEFCPLLDLPPNHEALAAYCTLASLDESLQVAVVEGTLPLEAALWVGQHPEEDRQVLLPLFTRLKMGQNRARECAAAIADICQRDGCSVAALLHTLDIAAILDAQQLSGPQKSERVRQVLHVARYPRLSAHEQQFQDVLRRLRLPGQVSLRPPPYFEGQQWQVSFHFRTRQELQLYARRLLEAADHAALDDLFALL